eukprot:TRINITY_DN4028_c0_g1_i2.p1 TRINITY_DN4028_c0_g1~~TRINITY_DN4028_c0_g1_i2.p1  ORF type:complete len:367 (+),score=123.69 TRINITY_DN4028_c0_g1_i2:60-1103(+)
MPGTEADALADQLADLKISDDAAPAAEAADGASGQSPRALESPAPEPLLDSFDLDGIASYIKEKDVRNIIVMTGAGISCAAGIPDFRTPGTGLYDNLEKYGLPYPEAIFTMDYLAEKPEPFFTLAKEMWPGKYRATRMHLLIRLLAEKGVLRRNYTQNIDGLEYVAGVPPEKVVAAHGHFESARCIRCKKGYSKFHVQEAISKEPITVPRCECGSIVKPDIVFFGESLPRRFNELSEVDLDHCDLLIIAGTSLVVHPFAGLAARVPADCPRIVLNNEPVGEGLGLVYEGKQRYRDVLARGCCQEQAAELAARLGWGEDLASMQTEFDRRFDAGELDSKAAEAAAHAK